MNWIIPRNPSLLQEYIWSMFSLTEINAQRREGGKLEFGIAQSLGGTATLARARMLAFWAVCLTLSGCFSDSVRSRQAVVRGRATAELWCSECHRVSPDQ